MKSIDCFFFVNGGVYEYLCRLGRFGDLAPLNRESSDDVFIAILNFWRILHPLVGLISLSQVNTDGRKKADAFLECHFAPYRNGPLKDGTALSSENIHTLTII